VLGTSVQDNFFKAGISVYVSVKYRGRILLAHGCISVMLGVWVVLCLSPEVLPFVLL
jgi:hypothetical protein